MSAMTRSVLPVAYRSPAVPTDYIWRLSVDQYHAMIRTGILTGDDPVELLEGWLVVKMPQNPPHRAAVRLIQQALERIVPGNWYVDTQAPITTAESEPEPDVVVVRGDTRQYLNRHPGPQDLALIVEVADTTVQRDRLLKKRLYALAGIPVYWIANLAECIFEVYTDPSGLDEQPDYRQCRDYGPTDEIPVAIEGVEIGRMAVRELLP
jgi:Uma2 family endonuclease